MVCHTTSMSSNEPASLIPVTLLTGFLGSGKTTVLNHVLKAARHGRDGGHRQRIRRDRSRPSPGRAVERGCRAAQQRLPVLHGAQRHRRHVDQPVRRPRQGQGPVVHPRRDRDHRPRRSGADPAHPDDRADRRRPLHARRRRHDGRRGQRGRRHSTASPRR